MSPELQGAGGGDNPLVWFEGATTTFAAQRQLIADHQGSIVAVGLNDGTNLAMGRYDEYGIPQSANQGRFGYTGQIWIPELGQWYYKARMYSPTLGRFMQTDPIGYGDGMAWYNYVHSDPVNWVDPTGMDACVIEGEVSICVYHPPVRDWRGAEHAGNGSGGFRGGGGGGGGRGTPPPPSPQKKYQRISCSAAQSQSGKIDITLTTGSFIAGTGAYASFGTFYNQSTGARGGFYALGGGFGVDLGISELVGSVNSLAAFSGNGRAVTVGVGAGVSFIYDAKGNYIGNLKGIADRGASFSLGKTTLFGCEAPQ